MPLAFSFNLPLRLFAFCWAVSFGAPTLAESQPMHHALGDVTTSIGSITFRDCELTSQQRSRTVECAYFTVPENHAAPDSRQLSLLVVRIPARNPRGDASPFLAIAGGPGQAASEAFLYLDRVFSDVTRNRDVYLIDQRGTGGSNPQHCDLDMDETLLVAPAEDQLRASAEECLARFSGNPVYYTTSVAVQDLERVRNALALAPWNLFGVSYGTRVVQQYVRQYPDAVRTATLDSVLPAPVTLGPDIALHSQRALEAFLRRCTEDTACAETFPDLTEGLQQLLAELASDPRTVLYEDVRSGTPTEMTFSHAHLVGLLRLALYSSERLSTLPPMLHQAYANDNFTPLARNAVAIADEVGNTLAMGMHNAIVCSEDVPFYAYDDATAAAIDATYMGDLVLSGLEATCSVWPQGQVDEHFKSPLVTDVPVLVISGALDPITPPAYGDAIMPGLSQGRHLVAAGQGHTASVQGCMPTIVAQFINEASTDNLPIACMDRLDAAPLLNNFNGPTP
ncbi:MAG: alpha/beta hydrolase [Natronospirillum sp.]